MKPIIATTPTKPPVLYVRTSDELKERAKQSPYSYSQLLEAGLNALEHGESVDLAVTRVNLPDSKLMPAGGDSKQIKACVSLATFQLLREWRERHGITRRFVFEAGIETIKHTLEKSNEIQRR